MLADRGIKNNSRSIRGRLKKQTNPEKAPRRTKHERTAALEMLLQLLLGDVERKVAY